MFESMNNLLLCDIFFPYNARGDVILICRPAIFLRKAAAPSQRPLIASPSRSPDDDMVGYILNASSWGRIYAPVPVPCAPLATESAPRGHANVIVARPRASPVL